VVVRFTAARYDTIAARIGYRFKDKALLRHALTHASTRRKHNDYQRLEFLGDRVLGLVVAEALYRMNSSDTEGHMAGRHSYLVRGETCAAIGRILALTDFIVMGESERHKGLALNSSVLGDVVEALIGGIYIDGGLAAAAEFILKNWHALLNSPTVAEKDAKTFLQEWVLARALPIPAYRTVSREGPEHAPVFVVAVDIKGHMPVEGSGKNKRVAEQEAATKFLAREKIRT
jgi:ribonuclease III